MRIHWGFCLSKQTGNAAPTAGHGWSGGFWNAGNSYNADKGAENILPEVQDQRTQRENIVAERSRYANHRKEAPSLKAQDQQTMTSALKIVKYPHPALRQKAQPITAITAEVRQVAERMLELMYEHEGLGLAAPQVALPWQLIVLNFSADPQDKVNEFVAINPVILESKGSVVGREGCLSFPGLYQNIRRAKTVKVQAYNLQGELYEMVCHDLPARVWQHEIDHLHGILFIDRMGSMGRERSARDLQQLIAEFEDEKKKGLLPADLVARL